MFSLFSTSSDYSPPYHQTVLLILRRFSLSPDCSPPYHQTVLLITRLFSSLSSDCSPYPQTVLLLIPRLFSLSPDCSPYPQTVLLLRARLFHTITVLHIMNYLITELILESSKHSESNAVGVIPYFLYPGLSNVTSLYTCPHNLSPCSISHMVLCTVHDTISSSLSSSVSRVR